MASYSVYHNANSQSFVRHVYHPPITNSEYDEIKSKTQKQWSHEARRKAKSATVYEGEFTEKKLDETAQPKMRPNSPTRMNKPHPPQIFLVTTLHNIPGRYNCEKLKGSAEPGEKTQASYTHKKERGKNDKVQAFCDPSSNLAAEAWMKLASDKDSKAVEKMLNYIQDKSKETNDRRSYVYQAFNGTVKPEYIISAHRWLKKAGAEETAAVERLLRTLSTAPQLEALKETPGMPQVYKRAREYIIHTDWRSEH
ncbi:uncharacterized protein O3C94_000302 [Discoglossus pictus]